VNPSGWKRTRAQHHWEHLDSENISVNACQSIYANIMQTFYANYVYCITLYNCLTVPQCPHNNPKHHKLHSSDPRACFPGSCLRKPCVSCQREMQKAIRRTGTGWEHMAQGIGLKAQAWSNQPWSWCNRELYDIYVYILYVSYIYLYILFWYAVQGFEQSKFTRNSPWMSMGGWCKHMQPISHFSCWKARCFPPMPNR